MHCLPHGVSMLFVYQMNHFSCYLQQNNKVYLDIMKLPHEAENEIFEEFIHDFLYITCDMRFITL